MFEIGWTELLIIGVVAILVVPPKDLPALMRTIGKYMGQLRRMAGEFRSQFDEAMREAEMKELQEQLRKEAREIEKLNPMTEAERSVNDSFRKLESETAPTPAAVETAKPAAEANEVVPAAPIASAPGTSEPARVETEASSARPSVAERVAQAWKKAAGADSGA